MPTRWSCQLTSTSAASRLTFAHGSPRTSPKRRPRTSVSTYPLYTGSLWARADSRNWHASATDHALILRTRPAGSRTRTPPPTRDRDPGHQPRSAHMSDRPSSSRLAHQCPHGVGSAPRSADESRFPPVRGRTRCRGAQAAATRPADSANRFATHLAGRATGWACRQRRGNAVASWASTRFIASLTSITALTLPTRVDRHGPRSAMTWADRLFGHGCLTPPHVCWRPSVHKADRA